MSENKTPRVGIGCWIFNPTGQVLLGLRLSPHGYGTWAAPGGKLEFNEEPADCAARELREETGIIIPSEKFQFVCITNDIYPDAHYITLHYRTDSVTANQNQWNLPNAPNGGGFRLIICQVHYCYRQKNSLPHIPEYNPFDFCRACTI